MWERRERSRDELPVEGLKKGRRRERNTGQARIGVCKDEDVKGKN